MVGMVGPRPMMGPPMIGPGMRPSIRGHGMMGSPKRGPMGRRY